MTDGQKRAAREVQEAQAIRCRGRGVEQHAIGDEAHEQGLDHLEPGGQDREHEYGRDGPALGPEPAQIVVQYSRRALARAVLAGCWLMPAILSSSVPSR